ncbi:MAG: twin-arginine translocase subunit TatC [Gemmatimonadaceae bacterium]
MSPRTEAEMPFLDHLEELRWRIIWALGALVVGVGLGIAATIHYDLIGLLQRPIAPYLHGEKLGYMHPGDSFSIMLSISFIIGIVIAAPVVLYQLWAFLAPALYQHEKRIAVPVIVAAVFLFAAGVAMAWFIVLPFSLRFLLNFESESLTPRIMASEYFGFATTMALTFGAVFELPIAILALTVLGLVRPEMLSRFRKHAFVLCFLVAAIVTPGDFLGTTVLLMIPLYFLYEVGIVLSRVVVRRRDRKATAAAAEARDGNSEATA